MAVKKRRATGEQLHDLFHEVFVLHDILFDVADEVHARAGLRTAQCRVADELERLGSATVPDVAAALNVSRQFVQTTCNELERIGVVRFSDSPRHKRSKLVSLTEAGRRTLARAAGIEAAVIEKALPDMDAAAVSKAQALLRDIRERVQATTRDRWG
jgi:DNA-binding MarR family transcriptional regulator